MTVLDSWMYGDPERILERKQETELRKVKACGDCIHKRGVEFRGEMGYFCAFKKHVYGRRCELYEIKKA